MTRLLVYDRTCRRGRRGLSPVWATGARLYQRLGRIDASRGVASWDEALAWLVGHDAISEIQYWGHGHWGCALVGRDVFGVDTLAHYADELAALRERLSPNALWWFRTCETFGARAGHELAMRLADALGARVAGHTYVIAFQQSGLHGLYPGMRPDWSVDEGLADGTPEAPRRALWSRPWAPRTITALTGRVPEAWFSGPGLQYDD
jgi:hypothetical protein